MVSAQLWLGFELVSFVLGKRLSFWCKIWLAVPFGFSFCNWGFFLCSLILRMTLLHVFAHTGGCLFLAFLFSLRRGRSLFVARPSRVYVWTMCLSAILIVSLLHTSYLPSGNDVLSVGSENLVEEISLINSFLTGCNRGRLSPFVLAHPYGVDVSASTRWFAAYHSASLMAGLASLRTAMMVPSFLLILSSLALIYHIAVNFSRSEIAAACSVFMFVFVGGFGFVYHWRADHQDSPEVDYVHVLDKGCIVEWGSTLLDYLVPMRWGQWSLSLILGGVLCLSEIVFRTKKKIEHKELYTFAGALFGFIPVVDARLIFPCAVFVGVFCLLHFRSAQTIVGWIAFAIPCGGLIALQFTYIVVYLISETGIQVQPMWSPLSLRGVSFPSIALWVENLGIFAILSLVVCWAFLNSDQIRFYLPGIAVFILCNLVRYQAESRLNFIVLFPLWVSLAVVVVATIFQQLVNLSEDEHTRGAICAWCCLFVTLSSLSGVLAIPKQFTNRTYLWTPVEQKASEWIRSDTKYNSVFLGNCSRVDVSVMLGGRRVFCIDQTTLTRAGFKQTNAPAILQQFWINPSDTSSIPQVTHAIDETEVLSTSPNSWTPLYTFGHLSIYRRKQ